MVKSNAAEISDAETEIKNQVLSAGSEKTSYLVEMLSLDLDLETDLGMDTVEQAESFAIITAILASPGVKTSCRQSIILSLRSSVL